MEPEIKDMKYGLMVIDPTKKDADLLREELMTDEEFGLTDIANRLDILPAPDYTVEEFKKELE